MTPQEELQAALSAALEQLHTLEGQAEGDAQAAVQAVAAMVARAQGDSGAAQALAQATASLQDPAAQAWLQGLQSADTPTAQGAVQRLHGLGRHQAALSLADQCVRRLRDQAPAQAVALGDAALSWEWPIPTGPAQAGLAVTTAETALLSGDPTGAERLRAALHQAELRRHWRAQFQGVMALSIAAERTGMLQEAGVQADTGRALAVRQRDPQRYLAAMQRLIELAERAQDLPGAYGIAARAGASLEKLLGAPGKQAARQLFEGLQLRWGTERYTQAQAAWLDRQGHSAGRPGAK